MKNKTVLITGAAKNIGYGIADTLTADGYSCILLDVDKNALSVATAKLIERDGHCQEYAIDISNSDEIAQFFTWLKHEGITPEVLINNAAYESSESISVLSRSEISRSFATNLEGPFYLSSFLVREWQERKIRGNVVFISSTHSTITRSHPLYSSSKAAIEMFVKEAALELAKDGIRVNAVAPGPVEDSATPKENNYVPSGYSLQPSDVADAVSFLISEKARSITGISLVVDGGFSLAHTHYWKNQGKL